MLSLKNYILEALEENFTGEAKQLIKKIEDNLIKWYTPSPAENNKVNTVTVNTEYQNNKIIFTIDCSKIDWNKVLWKSIMFSPGAARYRKWENNARMELVGTSAIHSTNDIYEHDITVNGKHVGHITNHHKGDHVDKVIIEITFVKSTRPAITKIIKALSRAWYDPEII